ncbi:MAG TPA: transcription termination factor Rho [Desulfomonilaceae bacterium]|nr:transcription termination factor Rho [Desulfomonilaceae bacterium]
MAQKKKEQKEKAEKPLEDRTIKDLREEALKITEIQGVHGMNKQELLTIIRKAKGIPEPEKIKIGSVRETKTKINQLKQIREEERAQGVSRSRLNILRKKISRLKKDTRG